MEKSEIDTALANSTNESVSAPWPPEIKTHAADFPKNENAELFPENDEKMMTSDEGCGDGGLYSCPVHPELSKVSKAVREKTIRKHYNIKEIPTDLLVNELRRRQLEQKLLGKVTISPKGEVSFEIEKLLWPVGKYHVTIECIEEETYGESSASCCGGEK